uniref:Uncharacterized protein n=2 Tax=Aegilops tauschii subsp. strangulata TaxID=200361 RepID=A0A453GY15_AEGTS
MYRIVFPCHSSEESEVSESLLVMLQACGGDADGRREIRGLNGVVAADGFLRPLVVRHEHDIDRGLLELRVRARDVTASQLKAAAAVGQVWLARLLGVFHCSCRPHDQAG